MDKLKDVCSICLDPLIKLENSTTGLLSTPCEHYFHRECLLDWLKNGKPGNCCPYCKKEMKWSDAIPVLDPVLPKTEASTSYPKPSSTRCIFKRPKKSSIPGIKPKLCMPLKQKEKRETKPKLQLKLIDQPQAGHSGNNQRSIAKSLQDQLQNNGEGQTANTETRWQWYYSRKWSEPMSADVFMKVWNQATNWPLSKLVSEKHGGFKHYGKKAK